ncbi:MAG: LLM class F420-dependent oxidoreductase [Pseudomonadota bacterium]
MKFGFHMFTRGATATPDNIAHVASHCEALGFDAFGVSDHVVVSTAIQSSYPYSPDGSWAGAAEGECLETLSTLAYLAATTRRMRLFTSVMVLLHRPPVLAAKTLATIDVLSRGRLTIGAGVGWMKEELDLLGAPEFARRGAAANEYLRAFKTLWTDEEPKFAGEFVQFDDLMFAPKPVQPGGPPIWIGGEGTAARRRVAAVGDGWYPVSRNPRVPLDTLNRFRAALADVRERTDAAGRDPDALQIALFAPHLRVGKAIVEDGERLAFTGEASAIRDDIAAFEEAGLQTLVPNLDRPHVNDIIVACNEFAETVRM